MRGARYWVECDLCRDKGDHSVGEDCTTAKGRDEIYAAREACWSLNGSLHHNVARLLAEREAKMREERDSARSELAELWRQETEERDTLRARVAELEASRDHPRTWAAVEAREAQHLADIRALRRQLDLSDDVVREYASGYTELLRENTSVLAGTAHYGDAK